MKCPYCGGEVPSQSVSCPFCGRENPEGMAFQEEVRQKIERNKLLKPFLIKQKTPELVQRMLTRILLILLVINVGMLGLTFLIFLWTEREPNREPAAGSLAETYFEKLQGNDDYYFNNYYRDAIAFTEMLDNKEMPDDFEIRSLIDDAHRALEKSHGQDYQQDIYLFEKAFFRGIMGLTEEECAFLEPNEQGEYEYLYSDDARRELAIAAVERKMKEGAQ